ncbi:MAG: hypothetical protein H6619_02500, partial [Deltaproteobacteria bacterium]|nr:hypothetical protein [Deltaproteobacteria bacterium]
MLRVLFDRYDSAKTFTTILSCLGVFFYSGSTASFIGCATASPISQQDKQLSEGTHTVMSRDGSPYPAKIEVEAEEIPEIIALPEKKLSIDLSSLERSKGLQSSEVIGVFPIPLSSGQQLVSTAMKDGEIIGKSASSESGASYKLASLGAGISQIDYSLAEGLFGYLKGSELSVYSLQEGRKIISNRKLNTRIKSLKFQIDGKSLFVGAADGMIYEWKFADEIKQSRKHEEEYLQRYTGASSVINAIAMHREGRLFFTGDWNGDLIAWRTFDSDQR